MSLAPPRRVPLRTRVLIYLDFLWIPFLWLAVFPPWAASDYAESGLLTSFRACVDVPAEVVRTRPVSEMRGKASWWHGYRVWATFRYGGETLYAIGDMAQVPADGTVMARVPIHRPDLAVAFTGSGPHVNRNLFLSIVATGLGGAGFLLLLVTAFRFDRRLARAHIARAHALRQEAGKSSTYFRIAYPTAEGRVETNLTLDKAAARRVLANADFHVMYDPAKVTDPHALAAVDGVRWDETRAEVARAPWGRLVWKALPAACFAVGCVAAALKSYLLPPPMDTAIRTLLAGLWP